MTIIVKSTQNFFANYKICFYWL